MNLLFFYFLAMLSIVGNELVPQAELAMAQERYAYAYHLLDKEELSDESALLLLEAGVLSRQDVERPITVLLESEDSVLVSKRDFWMAVFELQNGEFGKALDQFNRLSQVPDFIYQDAVRRNLAKIHLELGNTAEAITIMEGNTVKPVDKMLYAELLLRNGELEKCREALNEGVVGDTESLWKTFLLAQIDYQVGDMEAAISRIENTGVSAYSLKGRRVLSFLCMAKSENEQTGGYGIMQRVLLNTTPVDPYITYLDQLLLAAQAEDKQNNEVRSDLVILREIWPAELQPSLLYTIAQLQEDVNGKVMTLSEIYREFPDHPMSAKACYLAAQLGLSIEDDQKREAIMEGVVADAPSDSLKVKIYSWIAERSSNAAKVASYTRALDYASIEQFSLLRLNANLAQFYLPRDRRQEFILSADQFVFYLYEQGVSLVKSQPEKAEELLQEFLRTAPEDARKGNAHLLLAEMALRQNDPNLSNEIRGHLDTVGSLYQEPIVDPVRYNYAQIQLALLSGETDHVSKYASAFIGDKGFLLKSGKLFYEQAQPHLASEQFKQLEAMELTSQEGDLVSLYLSLCYLKLNTQAHQNEALERLTVLSKSAQSYLQQEAKLTLAQHYLDNASPEQSLESLEGLASSSPKNLIKARAYSLMKGKSNKRLAAESYESLYRDGNILPLQRYQIALQYALFLNQEGMRGEEVELYYQVANFEVLPEPANADQWALYKTLCDRGVKLLESLDQWRSAHVLAKLVSGSNLPDSTYFKEKAAEISLKHILWDED